jgi:pimeloyl-ACP methyl ester carboxylesterase
VSGVGIQTRDEARASFGGFERESLVAIPDPIKDTVMFGEPGFITADMPAASYVSGAPAPAAELIDINMKWHLRLPAIAPRVSVPLHYRHAERDALWNELNVGDFAALFPNSPDVDVAQFPGAGHCIDFHTVGAQLQEEQLDFAEKVVRARAEAQRPVAGR